MLGEIFALASVFAFSLTNVAIAKTSGEKRGDNGAFLSIVMTCALSGVLWLAIGIPLTKLYSEGGLWFAIVMFVLSGVLSMAVGRSLMFRSIILAGAINGALFRRLIPVFAGLFAYIFLGETVTAITGLGMAIIIASLIATMKPKDSRAVPETHPSSAVQPLARSAVIRGQIYGALSSVAYGGSHVARKLGMQGVPDPILGALVGGLTGIAWYILAALFSARHRQAVTGLIRDTGPWQFAAAASMSVGQILMFYALMYTDVVIVAIIGSLEVFTSIYLAAYLLRTEARPERRTILASIAATVGVILVAIQ